KPRAHAVVVSSDLDREHALPHRRHEGLWIERLRVAGRQPESLEAGDGEDHTVPALAHELPEPRVDIAANGLHDEIRSQRKGQRPAARAPGTGPGAGAQALEAPGLARHQNVARVFALGKRGEHEARGKLGREVLEAVHRAIDRPVQEHVLDLSHEQPFSPNRRQLDVLPAISLRPHGHDLDLLPGAGEKLGDAPRLREGELTAARADADHSFLPRPSPTRAWPSSSRERGEPAREASRSLVIGACRILFTIALDIASMAARVSGVASGSRESVRFTSPARIASSRSRNETIVGITSTS